MQLLTLTLDAEPRRRPGRPKTTPRDRQRRIHIRVAFDRLARRLSVREVARIHRISRQTVLNWTELALSYPECEGLAHAHRSRSARKAP